MGHAPSRSTANVGVLAARPARRDGADDVEQLNRNGTTDLGRRSVSTEGRAHKRATRTASERCHYDDPHPFLRSRHRRQFTPGVPSG